MEALAPSVKVEQRKKQLLYLAVCDPDLEVTGATVRMGAFVKHLARYYDVTLVNMAGSGHRVAPAVEERCRDRDNRLGVTRRVRVDFSRAGYFLLSPAFYRAADAFLKKDQFDYLLADYGLAAVYGRILGKRYHVPLIYSSHNVEYRMYRDLSKHDFRRRLLTPYVYWAERAACRAARLVVAISEKDREQFTRWVPGNRVEVIPQGFDPQLANPFYKPAQESPPVIVFVGSFRSENNRLAGRHIVRKIAPAVLRVRSDVKFQLIGADPPSELAGPNVECPGFVDDLAPYLRRAHLVIAPMPLSHGMATKIISALAFGKTVVSTPEGATGIPRNYRQLVVRPLDSFASTVVELLSKNTPVDARDFETLCSDFGWPSLMARLYRRIERSCKSGFACGPGKAEETPAWL